MQGPEPRRVDKPWGHEIWWAQTPEYAGRDLLLAFGSPPLIAGSTEDDLEEQVLEPGESWRSEPGIIHSIEALEDSVLVEVPTPQLDDIIRLQDRYGRG